MDITKTNSLDSQVSQIVTNIQAVIEKIVNPAQNSITLGGIEGVQKSRGIVLPPVQAILKQSLNEEIKKIPQEDKKEVAHSLLASEYAEDRLAGCMIFEKIKKSIDLNDIKRVEELCVKGILAGFNIEEFASSIFTPWVKGSEENSRYISQWKDSECIWLQRASCHAFCSLVKHEDKAQNFKGFMKLMDEICETTIQSADGFVKMGAAWLLQHIGFADTLQLCDFLDRNIKYFSDNLSLAIAMEKLSQTEKKKYKALWNKKDLNELEQEVENEVQPEEKSERKRRNNSENSE